MDKSNIIIEVSKIFNEVLDRDDIVLNESTTANDIEEWDSLAHIHLVVAIERYFKIRFTSKEIQSWDNLGELVDSIQKKL